MSFHLSVPCSPPSLSNGYASHHKDFMSSLSFQSDLQSPPCSPNQMHSNNLTSPTNPHINSHHRHHHHNNTGGDHHTPQILVKPDNHMMYRSSMALHSSLSIPPPPSHLHPYSQTSSPLPAQLSGKHNIGILAGPKHGVVDFHPPTLSHTPVIIAE